MRQTGAIIGGFCFGAACASMFWLSHFERTTLDSARTGAYIKPAQQVTPEDEMEKQRVQILKNQNNNTTLLNRDRVITAAGEVEMDRLLSGPQKGSVTVIYISFDHEGVELATQIEGIFKRGGWKVEDRKITPRMIFSGLSASVPPNPSDAYMLEVLWKMFDDLQLERNVGVGSGHTNLTITIGFNDGQFRVKR